MLFIAQQRVRDFHWKFGCEYRSSPELPDITGRRLRMRLIVEEAGELGVAMERGDIVEAADGIADLLYVTLGTAVACGIDIEPVFIAVHNSNMLKDGGGTRPDGKILKPPGWTPPDIASILKKQGWTP